ncbi:hypothetical protein, partial [Pseudomonas piscis]
FLSAFDREDRNANKAKTLPYQLLLGLDELKRYRCRKPCNSLNIKEFSVSTAPEVGRIIDL